MSKKIRIAFFADVLQRHFDGVSNTIHQIADRLPPEVEVIFIVALPPKPEDGFQHQIYQLPYFAFPFNPEYRVGLPGLKRDLPRILADFKPDLIHYTSPSFMGRYAIRYAKKHGLPLTCIYHTHYYSYMEYYFGFFKPLESVMTRLALWLSKWFYKRPTRTFVPSEPMKAFLLHIGLREEQVSYFRRGINTQIYHPGNFDPNFRKQWGLEDKKVVLFVSRLVDEKELHTLSAIYDVLQARRKDIRMVITGDGPSRKRMEQHMTDAVFTGKQTKQTLAGIYASSDVFVFPSISETFGNVVLEALASGLPAVVATDGGPKGIVEEADGGFVVERKNPEAFADKLIEILDNDEVRKRFSENGIAYAQKQKWEDICGALYEEWRDIVEMHKRPEGEGEANGELAGR